MTGVFQKFTLLLAASGRLPGVAMRDVLPRLLDRVAGSPELMYGGRLLREAECDVLVAPPALESKA